MATAFGFGACLLLAILSAARRLRDLGHAPSVTEEAASDFSPVPVLGAVRNLSSSGGFIETRAQQQKYGSPISVGGLFNGCFQCAAANVEEEEVVVVERPSRRCRPVDYTFGTVMLNKAMLQQVVANELFFVLKAGKIFWIQAQRNVEVRATQIDADSGDGRRSFELSIDNIWVDVGHFVESLWTSQWWSGCLTGELHLSTDGRSLEARGLEFKPSSSGYLPRIRQWLHNGLSKFFNKGLLNSLAADFLEDYLLQGCLRGEFDVTIGGLRVSDKGGLAVSLKLARVGAAPLDWAHNAVPLAAPLEQFESKTRNDKSQGVMGLFWSGCLVSALTGSEAIRTAFDGLHVGAASWAAQWIASTGFAQRRAASLTNLLLWSLGAAEDPQLERLQMLVDSVEVSASREGRGPFVQYAGSGGTIKGWLTRLSVPASTDILFELFSHSQLLEKMEALQARLADVASSAESGPEPATDTDTDTWFAMSPCPVTRAAVADDDLANDPASENDLPQLGRNRTTSRSSDDLLFEPL